MQWLMIAQLIMGLAQGGSAFQAAKREKKDIQKQAGLVMREGEEEAERQRKIDNLELQRTGQAYLKSGVRLEGTPLEVLRAKHDESNRYIAAMREATRSRASFMRDKGKRVLAEGRAQMLGFGSQGASQAASTYMKMGG